MKSQQKNDKKIDKAAMAISRAIKLKVVFCLLSRNVIKIQKKDTLKVDHADTHLRLRHCRFKFALEENTKNFDFAFEQEKMSFEICGLACDKSRELLCFERLR